jgi:DNA-binding LacI/PurR family transcriptional regulator
LPAAHGSLQLDWSHFSAVAIGHTLVRPDLHRVSTYRFQAMRLAVRRLRELGYRRLGLALDANQDDRVDQQWAAAFQWEQLQVPPSQRTELFLARKQDWRERSFVRWFAANEPEAILGYDPEIVVWLRGLGHQVPRDVGFAHLWNPDQTGAFAGIYHNPPALGAAVVDFLIGLIQRNERGVPTHPQTVLLEPKWQDGQTVRRK